MNRGQYGTHPVSGVLRLREQDRPSPPPPAEMVLYTKQNNRLFSMDEFGVERDMTLPDITLTALRPFLSQWALACAGLDEVNIGVLGDSQTEGFTVTNRSYRWIDRVTQAARALLPGGKHETYLPAVASGGAGWPGNGVSPWTYVTGSLVGAGWGVKGRQLDPGSSMTTTFVGIGVRVIYTKAPGFPNSAALSVAIDGTTVATANPNGTAAYGNVLTWTGSTYGQHTLTISNVAGAGGFYVEGVFLLEGPTNGSLFMWEGGSAGGQASDFVATANQPKWSDILRRTYVPLVIIALGANDMTVGLRTSGQLASDLETMCTLINTAAAAYSTPYQPGILLMVEQAEPVGVLADASVWTDRYVPAIKSVAKTDPEWRAWLDITIPASISGRLQTSPTTLIAGDGLHANNGGHAWVANRVVEALRIEPLTSQADPFFGDGSDGALVFDGAATVLGMVPSANVYTMTRDINATDMTINSGVTVKPGSFRPYMQGTLTLVSSTSFLSNNGGAGGNAAVGVAGAAGAATATQTLLGSIAGVIGGAINVAGGAGTAATAASGLQLGGAGGRGGSANPGAAGGAAAAVVAQTANLGTPRTLYTALTGAAMPTASSAATALFIRGGNSGGAGGGQSATNAGGGSGAGGGTLLVACKILNNQGVISADGGAGGNGVGTTSGGGGGGGGGAVLLTYQSLINMGTVRAAGGAAGTGATVTPALAGGAGTVLIWKIAG